MAAFAVFMSPIRAAGALTIAWLVIGVALLAASAAALYASTRNDDLAAYRAAPHCATLSDAVAGNDCRYSVAATVDQVMGQNDAAQVFLTVPGGNNFKADLPFSTSAYEGQKVQVELWRGRVTMFGGQATAANPANDTRPGTLLVIGLILLPIGLGATAWGIVGARRPLTRGPSMSPVAMSDVLWR